MNKALQDRVEFLHISISVHRKEEGVIGLLADLVPEDVVIRTFFAWFSEPGQIGLVFNVSEIEEASKLRAAFRIRDWAKKMDVDYMDRPRTSYVGTGPIGKDDRVPAGYDTMRVEIIVNGQLPASCKLVEKLVEVPEHVVAASVVKKLVVECDKGGGE